MIHVILMNDKLIKWIHIINMILSFEICNERWFLFYPLPLFSLVVPDDIRNLTLKSQTKKESFPYKMMKLLNFQFLLVTFKSHFVAMKLKFLLIVFYIFCLVFEIGTVLIVSLLHNVKGSNCNGELTIC